MGFPSSPVALGALAFLVIACGSTATPSAVPSQAPPSTAGKPPFIPQIVSSEAAVGKNRFLLGILDAAGSTTIGAPDVKVQVTFLSGTAATPTIPTIPATFVWAIQGERGIYVVNVDFPSPGDWRADVSANGGGVPSATVEVQFQVAEKSSAIPIGGKAPDTKTPTLVDVGGDPKKLSTDPNPDPAFYTASVDEALRKHEPFVLIFATPAFCTSRQCGPTLDAVKGVAKDEPGVIFINVEPYQLQYADGRLQPVLDANGQLQATDVTNAWGILSEPWVFVIDRDGIVRGSFEAVIAPDELKAAIDAVK